MEMMDSVDLPFAQSTSKVDNRFNGWSVPLFKVALCPRRPPLPLRPPSRAVESGSSILPLSFEESNFFKGKLMKKR